MCDAVCNSVIGLCYFVLDGWVVSTCLLLV